jgi:hypothetical protein
VLHVCIIGELYAENDPRPLAFCAARPHIAAMR